MSEVAPWTPSTSVDIRTSWAIARLTNATCKEQTRIRAISMLGEFAVSEVSYLKEVQRAAEQRNVDAADAIALIVNQTVLSIARRVATFGDRAV